MSLANVGGVFVVLLAGMGLACLIAVFEFIWKSRKLATDENVRHSKLIAKALSHTNENMFHVPRTESKSGLGFNKEMPGTSHFADAASIAFAIVEQQNNDLLKQRTKQSYVNTNEGQQMNYLFNKQELGTRSRYPILT